MTTARAATPSLRSRNWFAAKNLDGFMHRAYLKAEGFSEAVFDGRPVIGIANSWSELNNCNAHLRQVAEAVKRGVWSAESERHAKTLRVADGNVGAEFAWRFK